jgi:hypothetical protein
MRIVKDNGYEHKNLTVQELLADCTTGGNVTLTMTEAVSGSASSNDNYTIVTDVHSLNTILGILIRSMRMTDHYGNVVRFAQDGSGIFRDVTIHFTVS